MSELPVKEMVLYKHGVGFFRRVGKVKGKKVTLTFREDEINDVLKSLAIFDEEGGQVHGIHYQTPMDQAARLADSSIRLSDRASLCDLLKSLRGREVELEFAQDTVRGRLVGVDVEDEERIERSLVSVISDSDGKVRVFRLRSLRGVSIRDERADHDLHYFLDTSMSEDVRRQVTLRLSGGSHKLVVYYVAPSPTWRVSYRLVAESVKDGAGGEALLQGWGLFDNRLDEDLVDVQVTLVAGQPISFIYDLYASRIPQRPTVRDEARIAPGPVEFEAALAEERPADMAGETAFLIAKPAAPAPAGMGKAMAADRPMRRAEMQQAAPPAAVGREAGEFFEYVVTSPVTVQRGESALVPIIGASVTYSKEFLYNGAKLPDHPVAAIRFENTTGLTLERGPVTIVEDGEYRGEAVVPFTRSDNEVYLAYAVELGVRVTERAEGRTEMAGLDIRHKYLIINEYHVRATTCTLENTTDRDLAVTLEAPIRADYELFDTPDPDEETAAERRWRVAVPAHGSAGFTRSERRLTRRHEEVRNLDYRRLQRFMDDRWLDQATFEMLTTLLDNLAFIENARAAQDDLRTEREEIYQRQAQLRENLTTLKPAGEEGPLRSRMLHQLEATEDRVEAIEARLAELDEQVATAEAQIGQTLALLGGEDGG
jgi:hypothetical protein